MVRTDKRKFVAFSKDDCTRYAKLRIKTPFQTKVKQLMYDYLDEMELKLSKE